MFDGARHAGLSLHAVRRARQIGRSTAESSQRPAVPETPAGRIPILLDQIDAASLAIATITAWCAASHDAVRAPVVPIGALRSRLRARSSTDCDDTTTRVLALADLGITDSSVASSGASAYRAKTTLLLNAVGSARAARSGVKKRGPASTATVSVRWEPADSLAGLGLFDVGAHRLGPGTRGVRIAHGPLRRRCLCSSYQKETITKRRSASHLSTAVAPRDLTRSLTAISDQRSAVHHQSHGLAKRKTLERASARRHHQSDAGSGARSGSAP